MKRICFLPLLFASFYCLAQVSFQKNIGGDKFERALFVDRTSDDGYIVCGYSNSFGDGSYDIYVVKLDNTANIHWQKTFGGNRTDIGWGIHYEHAYRFPSARYSDDWNRARRAVIKATG